MSPGSERSGSEPSLPGYCVTVAGGHLRLHSLTGIGGYEPPRRDGTWYRLCNVPCYGDATAALLITIILERKKEKVGVEWFMVGC